MTGGPAVCEHSLRKGGNCGVPAIGRCATCELAFCATHQAREAFTKFVDQCSACLFKATEPARRQEAEADELLKREDEIAFALVERLRTSSIPRVRQQVGTFEKRGLLGRAKVWYDETDVEGWAIGDLPWSRGEIRTEMAPSAVDANGRVFEVRAPERDRFIDLRFRTGVRETAIERMRETLRRHGVSDEV